MLSTLRNAWKIPELRKRIIFTLLMLLVYRIGNFIPVPGVNKAALMSAMSDNSQSLLSLYDLMNGGALTQCSIFAMGVVPYINSSIIMQLLTVAIPHLENLSKEGDDGRKKIQRYTRFASIIFSIIQAYATYAIMTRFGAIDDYSYKNIFMIMITLIAASSFLMWLGDRVTERGIGNGMSLIICIGIISRVPSSILQIGSQMNAGQVNLLQAIILSIVMIVLVVAVVAMSMAERRIPIQYASKANGRHFKQNSNIPFAMTASVVISIIFASSVMRFPETLANFFPDTKFASVFASNAFFSIFRYGTIAYNITNVICIIFFTWFYTQIIYKTDEMAENIHKSAGFIPGVRPGEPTRIYIDGVLARISIISGIFAALVATFPVILESISPFTNLALGGTALLILVNVAIESMKFLESQLIMRHYEGFLKR